MVFQDGSRATSVSSKAKENDTCELASAPMLDGATDGCGFYLWLGMSEFIGPHNMEWSVKLVSVVTYVSVYS